MKKVTLKKFKLKLKIIRNKFVELLKIKLK